MKAVIFTICILIASATAYSKTEIASARIESCRGCSLNRLPEVKAFILDDAPKYERLEVKFITGAPPELVILDAADQELERISLSALNREECNDLVKNMGFGKKPKDNSEF